MKQFRLLLFLLLLVLCVGSQKALAQDLVMVSGVITSEDTGEPLSGVVVSGTSSSTISSTSAVAVSKNDGSYSISVAPGTKISFQAIGYVNRWYTLPATSAGSVRHDEVLELDLQSIDDVVVVAYGVRKKGTVAGSVAMVKGDKLENVPTASFDQALQGQAPGLTVISNSGEPSATASFKIRGTNSINAGTAPLFILDGIPISSADFSSISPADIESISVLKDAASTSIYGARASNGVVVITSKRGKVGEKAQVTFRSQLGFSQLAYGKWRLMNTAERIQYEQEVGLTTGKDYDKLSKIDINWRDEVFDSSAPLQSYDLQVSGATEHINYYISGGYFSQDGMTSDSDFERFNYRFNIDARANNWLRVGTNTMLSREKYATSEQGSYNINTPISAIRFMLPYDNPYKADGSLASISDGSWTGTSQNPLEWVKYNPYKTTKNKVIANVFFEITPIKGLTIRSQGGIDYTQGGVKTVSYPSYAPNNGSGTATRSSTEAMRLIISNTVNYKFDVNNDHQFTVMAGQEGIDYFSDSFGLTTAGQSNDNMTDLTNGTRATSWSNSRSENATLSVFGRGEYNYRNLYYAELSFRGDASSRFGENNRWGTFWAAGFMWNMKSEKMFSDIKWLHNAQLSVSYGTSGNSEIPDYAHLAYVAGGLDYLDQAAIAPASKGNEKLSWEKTRTANVGLKMGFLNRFDLDVEFYHKKTTDMLMAVQVSYADGGLGYRWDNVGAMVNKGVEFNLNASIIRNKNFSWSVNANAGYAHNEITELYNGLDEYVLSSSGLKLSVGHAYNEFFLTRYAGVNPANGDALWYTKDGEITNEYSESDKVLTGKSSVAPWEGGFGTTVSWKGITLAAQFSWVANRYMINNDRYFEENSTFDSYNQSKRMLYDRWKKPGDITDIPRHGVTPQFDTHLLENASFMRLKNLMVSYSFPQDLLKKTNFLSAARIYFQAQNLFTITKFSGLDPESSSNTYAAQYPMSRQFSFGIEVTF